MFVTVITKDKPDSLQLRLVTRDAHVAYLKSSDCVRMAGPFIDDDGKMSGSLVVLEVETMEDARKWAANDPYVKAGLFEKSRIEHWNKVIG